MPKSKRDKKISLTKTSKKGIELKHKTVDEIRKNVVKYKSIYLFSVHNMRNDKLKELRTEWNDSKFIFGKNKVMALGLGKSDESEAGDKLHKLSKRLRGQCGLLFTNQPKKYVTEWFSNFGVEDYARSGFKAAYDLTLPEGPLGPQFAHSIEPYLRQLGMPTKLDKGVVTLLKSYEVCKKGVSLTPEQAKILKLLDHKMATFKLVLNCVWIKDKGFKKLIKDKDLKTDEDDVTMNEIVSD